MTIYCVIRDYQSVDEMAIILQSDVNGHKVLFTGSFDQCEQHIFGVVNFS